MKDGDRMVTGEYMGGPYVELFFGHYNRSIEVINVWDDETNTASIQVKHADIKAVIRGWIAEMDHDWPEWYESYIESARYY